MIAFLVRRLIGTVAVFYLVASLVFVMVHAAPGNVATTIGGTFGSPESVAQLERDFGLDKPLPVQYFIYIGNLTTLDLGTSNVSQIPVTEQLASRAAPTLELAGLSILFAVVLALILGVSASLRPGSWVDGLMRFISVVAISTPQFWLGLILIVVFGVAVPGILPSGGFVPWSESPRANLEHLVLPVFVLGLGALGVIARTIRAAMLEVMERDYVAFAIGTGLSRKRVVRSVALPNASIPTTTVIGLLVGYLVGGTVVVEQVFSIPGIGQMLVESFALRDIPSGIGATLFVAAVFLIANFAVDVAYGLMDPRIRALYRGDTHRGA